MLWPDKSESPTRWWAQTLAVAALALWALLLVVTASLDHHRGPLGHSLSIALGTADPFSAEGGDAAAVLLAVFSWLLVPAVIGTVVGLVAQTLVLRARPLLTEDAEKQIQELAERRFRELAAGDDNAAPSGREQNADPGESTDR